MVYDLKFEHTPYREYGPHRVYARNFVYARKFEYMERTGMTVSYVQYRRKISKALIIKPRIGYCRAYRSSLNRIKYGEDFAKRNKVYYPIRKNAQIFEIGGIKILNVTIPPRGPGDRQYPQCGMVKYNVLPTARLIVLDSFGDIDMTSRVGNIAGDIKVFNQILLVIDHDTSTYFTHSGEAIIEVRRTSTLEYTITIRPLIYNIS